MNRRGFTLMELIVTIGIIGLLAVIGLPRIGDAFRKQSVVSAKAAVVSLHAAARANAVQRAYSTFLVIDGNTLRMYSRDPLTGSLQQIGNDSDLGDRYGVAVSATRDTLWFDPRGLGMETSSTRITLTKGVYTQTVEISSLGRVQQ